MLGVETRDLFHDLDVELGQDVRKLEREVRMKREVFGRKWDGDGARWVFPKTGVPPNHPILIGFFMK